MESSAAELFHDVEECSVAIEGLIALEDYLTHWYDTIKDPESIGGAMMEMLSTDVQVHTALGLKTKAYQHLAVEAAQDLYMSGLFSAIGDTVTTIYDKIIEMIQKFIAWIKRLITGKDDESDVTGGRYSGSSKSVQSDNRTRLEAAQATIRNASQDEQQKAYQALLDERKAEGRFLRNVANPQSYFEDVGHVSGLLAKVDSAIEVIEKELNGSHMSTGEFGELISVQLEGILKYHNDHFKLMKLLFNGELVVQYSDNDSDYVKLMETDHPEKILPVALLDQLHTKLSAAKIALAILPPKLESFENKIRTASKTVEHAEARMPPDQRLPVTSSLIHASQKFLTVMFSLVQKVHTVYDGAAYRDMTYIIKWNEEIAHRLKKNSAKPKSTP